MPNIFEIVRSHQQTQRGFRQQQMTQGTVIGPDRSQYKVVAGAFTFYCHNGIDQALKPGDRVWIIAGRGTARIVGLMGKDESAT